MAKTKLIKLSFLFNVTKIQSINLVVLIFKKSLTVETLVNIYLTEKITYFSVYIYYHQVLRMISER